MSRRGAEDAEGSEGRVEPGTELNRLTEAVIGAAIEVDLLIARRVLVELKASEGYLSVHLAQVMSYLKATRLTLGLLIHFNVRSLRDGVRRVVRTPLSSAPSAPLRRPPNNSAQ